MSRREEFFPTATDISNNENEVQLLMNLLGLSENLNDKEKIKKKIKKKEKLF
jgi:hypothetical protein